MSTQAPIIDSIPAIAAGLKNGHTLLYPTDTIWGLGCDATHAAAVARLYALKERDLSKSMLVLLPSPEAALALAPRLTEAHLRLLLSSRPTTVLVPVEEGCGLVPQLINGGYIGLRLPQHPFCQQLLQALGSPLVSTSANLSGQPSPRSFASIHPSLLAGVDAIAHPRFDTSTNAQPSRILKLSQEGEMIVIRP